MMGGTLSILIVDNERDSKISKENVDVYNFVAGIMVYQLPCQLLNKFIRFISDSLLLKQPMCELFHLFIGNCQVTEEIKVLLFVLRL